MNWSSSVGRLLTAFTIEFDHETERRMVHQTTVGTGAGRGPWLVSMAFWLNFIEFIPDDGWAIADAAPWAAVTNLAGFQRWGYVEVQTVDGDAVGATDPRAVVRLSRGGRHARKVWRGLAEEVESRWCDRFGTADIAELKAALTAEPCLPALPVVSMADGLRSPPTIPNVVLDHRLPARLSAALLQPTMDFERDSPLSMVSVVDILPFLDADGIGVATLADRSGVSREAIDSYAGFLERGLLATRRPNPHGRGQLLALTERGEQQRRNAGERLQPVRIPAADDLLGRRAADGTFLLAAGLEPPDGGWRTRSPYLKRSKAFVADPESIPAQPVILHRGGFPDGS